MTKYECAIVTAFTGYSMLKGEDFNIFYDYIKSITGKTIYTHELPKYTDEIQEKSKPDFLKLCENATD